MSTSETERCCQQVDLERAKERSSVYSGKLQLNTKIHHCPYCGYSTIKTTNLIRHIHTHTGEKPFACPHCPFRATQEDNLKRHVRTHTGEKPYACSLCSYRSRQQSSLKRHVYTHHN
ncbi:hypothetical protein C7M84_019151 [Penaeus vannamei]|uniref:C2H2-type domain-containing protein n=1 Tax=Penaeus vannamei TaxID=6689 RepID=A0A3R7SIX1_PENVA|nr:hypothetical protein C7M84_019151 [Penaeus vannamei]